MNEDILMDILESNEKRAVKQKELIDKYNNSLISFTLNIPGKVKDKPVYREMHIEGVRAIEESLKENNISFIYKEEKENITGREAYMLAEIDSISLKKMMTQLEENHSLGRIFDIDVFNSKNQQISRKDIKEASRKCLICEKDVLVCMREKNHTYESLVKRVNIIYEEYKIK